MYVAQMEISPAIGARVSAAGAGRDIDVIITVAPGSLLSKAQSGIPCGFKMSFN